MSDHQDDLNPPPWWKQFWPWFLISIPAATVVASMFTINAAVTSDDGLVSKNYYQDGLAIHRDADALLHARKLGIHAKLDFDQADNLLKVDVTSATNQALGTLMLSLHHPTRADRDSLIQLQPTGPSTYQAKLPTLATDNWNVELSSAESGWQLHGRLNLSRDEHLTLQ